MQFFNMNNVFEVMVRAIVLFTAIPVHESAHAYVADKLGDPTARNLGRITLNPLPHLDLFGSILLLLTGFGWAKPVPIATRNFKNIRRDMALSALAGPVSNILMALVVLVIFKLVLLLAGMGALAAVSFTTLTAISQILVMMVSINVSLAIFNLVPVPPLDGSRLLTALLPPKIYYAVMRHEQIFMAVLFFGLITGVFSLPLNVLSSGMLRGMDFITGFMGRIYA